MIGQHKIDGSFQLFHIPVLELMAVALTDGAIGQKFHGPVIGIGSYVEPGQFVYEFQEPTGRKIERFASHQSRTLEMGAAGFDATAAVPVGTEVESGDDP